MVRAVGLSSLGMAKDAGCEVSVSRQDVDLLIEAEDADAIDAELARLGYRLRRAGHGTHNTRHFASTGVRVFDPCVN